MPAAQSFIQNLGTFLAKLFNFLKAHFSNILNSHFNLKKAKTIGITRLIL